MERPNIRLHLREESLDEAAVRATVGQKLADAATRVRPAAGATTGPRS